MSYKLKLCNFFFLYTGVIAPVIVWILGTVSETKPSLLTAYRTIRYISSLCPSFNLVRSIMAIVEVVKKHDSNFTKAGTWDGFSLNLVAGKEQLLRIEFQ